MYNSKRLLENRPHHNLNGSEDATDAKDIILDLIVKKKTIVDTQQNQVLES